MSDRRVALGLVCAALVCAALGQRASAGQIDPALAARLAHLPVHAMTPVIVELDGKPAIEQVAAQVGNLPRTARGGAIAAQLRSQFDGRKTAVIAAAQRLGATRVDEVWIAHALAIELPQKQIAALAATPGVAWVFSDTGMRSTTPHANVPVGVAHARSVQRKPAPPKPLPSFPEPDFSKLKPAAHHTAIGATAWWERGFLGRGSTVAIVDSGVNPREAALGASYRGGSADWFDPYGQQAQPRDVDGHGSLVASVAVGAGGLSPGIAPAGRWIAARLFDDNGIGRMSAVHRIYQWVLDPDGQAQTPDTPDVVNNSWGMPTTAGRCSAEFSRDIALMRLAGVHVVFAAGNDGPERNTSISPANNVGALAVGALDGQQQVARRTSRGPSACDKSVYPAVFAPGVGLPVSDRAAMLLGETIEVDGSSFAAAVVSGALLLAREANRQGSVDEIERAVLASSGVDSATPDVRRFMLPAAMPSARAAAKAAP